MQQKIRVGIIGVGNIAGRHIKDLLALPEAEIVGLADVNPKQIAASKEKFPDVKDVPEFTDYREMITATSPDAVSINTPHTLHFEQAVHCFNVGQHILMEKPMVCCVEHARELIRVSEEKERVLMVAYQRHFMPQFRYIKKTIESGAIGDITFIAALQGQKWLIGTGGTWRQDPSLSGGGQLNDSGSHLLDVILWTTGLAVKSVSAYIDNRGTLVDINSALAMEFDNGAKGTVSVVGDSLSQFYEDLTIWGTKGAIFYRLGKIMQTNENGEISEPTELLEAGNPATGFINAILGRDKNWVPPTCGLRVIELTEAAWESARTGTPALVKQAVGQ